VTQSLGNPPFTFPHSSYHLRMPSHVVVMKANQDLQPGIIVL